MTGPTLEDDIMALFAGHLNITIPSPDADLLASGLLDSLALVELLFQLESIYGVRISLENLDLESFRSVASIAAFVARERDA